MKVADTINKSKDKEERHILALSGGKDSAALAVYMLEKYPKLNPEYVFTDSGCELPETYEYLDRIRAVLNIKITVIKPEKSWENYWALTKIKKTKYGNFTYLPSPKSRWCTEVLKLIPYDSWLMKNYFNHVIHSYVGLRADEKRDREGFTSLRADVISHHPFIEDGLVYEDIKKLLIKSGLGFPKYYKWRKRSGCYFCFYQTKREWLGLYKHHPNLFMKAKKYETIIPEEGINFTWCENMSLEELLNNKDKILLKEFTEDNSGKFVSKLSDILADITTEKGEKICK
ncbi:phosphoadenosine phosphosulfate reductase family protein [candidate division NPL-UPA2 bacterium]|nr:phosphoadenosine phosphosulfate reductase family protein [candidate division NPL-UPA2 bacterium]